MEPNKMENQFREKLGNRKINPSEEAWDRLDAMLSVADSNDDKLVKHKFIRNRFWLNVAAVTIGFLLIGTFFLNNKEEAVTIKKNDVVIENVSPKVDTKTETKLTEKETNFDESILKKESKPLTEIKKKEETIAKNQILKTEQEVVEKIQTKTLNEPIVVYENVHSDNIDSLIASVEKNANAKKSTVKINPNTLLNQVDEELQVSFREKVLNTISQKYKETKEALVNRNNQ